MKCLAAPIMFTSFEIRVVLLVGSDQRAVESGSIHVYYRQAKMNFHFQNLQGIPTSFVQSLSEARTENQSIEKFAYW